MNRFRRSAHYKGEYPGTIRFNERHVERYPSGVAGLAEMTRGGWLRNSIVILRGQAGSGRTMLAGLYARAGAARGERVVYDGFEPTRSILHRNLHTPQHPSTQPRDARPGGMPMSFRSRT